MAKYGARNSFWAPWATETQDSDSTKLPAYGEAKTFGELNKVTDSINFMEGSLPGDDQIVLYQKRFKDGTVDVESVFLPVADAAAMLGSAKDEADGMAEGTDDEAPYIGYGFLTHHIGKGKDYWQAVFFPKLQASPTSGTYDTRGENINFATDKMSFRMLAPLCKKYRIIKDFPNEQAAATYLAGLFTGNSAVPGLTSQQNT